MSADFSQRVGPGPRPPSPGAGFGPARERILDVATALFAERGFHAATVRDLAARADVNVAAINYHFRSKDELYARVLDRALSSWSAEIVAAEDLCESASLESVLRAIVEALVSPTFEREDSGVVVRLLAWALLERPASPGGRIGAFAVVLAQLLDRHLPAPFGADDSLLLAQWLVGQCLLVNQAAPSGLAGGAKGDVAGVIVRLAMHGVAGIMGQAPTASS